MGLNLFLKFGDYRFRLAQSINFVFLLNKLLIQFIVLLQLLIQQIIESLYLIQQLINSIFELLEPQAV